MSVNWDSSACAAHHKALKAAMVSNEFDNTVKEWDEYTDLRDALIWALLIVKFPAKSEWKITQGNWEEIYLRLHILEIIGKPYRIYSVPDKDDPTKASTTDRRKVYFSPEEIFSMIGLAVNAGNLSKAKYQSYIYKELLKKAEFSLMRYKSKVALDYEGTTNFFDKEKDDVSS